MGELMCFQHFRPFVYFFRQARSPAVTYPGHAWLLVPLRKELRPRSPALCLWKGITPQPLMTHHDSEPAASRIPEEEEIHLALSELLPANHTLVVNPVKRVLIMLNDEPGGEAQRVKVQNISPSGIRVLIPLLQAYPKDCPYDILLTHLYPMPVEDVHKQLQEARETTMRPLRRAMSTINADLRPFGLQVTSVRNTAYTLKRLP